MGVRNRRKKKHFEHTNIYRQDEIPNYKRKKEKIVKFKGIFWILMIAFIRIENLKL